MTGDDSSLLGEWSQYWDMELECDHTGTGISVYNRSDETKKKQEIFYLEYLLVSLVLIHKYF